jgi:hypothetical protein
MLLFKGIRTSRPVPRLMKASNLAFDLPLALITLFALAA